MNWFNGIVVYILVWWVTLFAVLPLWVKPADRDDPGYAVGAPQNPHLLRKAAVTTGLAALIWLVIFVLVSSPWLSFHGS
jgi:predicted secreted protein